MDETKQLPLEGLRVIEIGTMITAPLAASILAEMGAEVIKVERPEGDPFRSFVGGSYAPHFRAYNKGKGSITLDLREEADRERLRELLRSADALVENFRPGVMDRLGFPADTIATSYPQLIYCSITGFGTEGPYRDRPAYDTVALALSGIANLKIDPEKPGIFGPTTSDNVTGMYAAQAIMAALIGRERNKTARRVEVNMLEASIAFTPDSFAMADEGHTVDRLTRVRASQSYAMRSSDDKLLVIHLSSAVKFWEALLAVVDNPALSKDPRFETRKDRYENYVELQEELARIFLGRTLDDWIIRLLANDVPFSPALTIEEVPENEQVRSLGTFSQITAGDRNTYQVINAPVRFDGQRPTVRRAPPLLGEDNDRLANPENK
jgi:crotonobetainyl-CoA:carnitine CoA-transferase CaiB-like acyl-CoA transferase